MGRTAESWTPERRARQAAAIRRWQPWTRSTGPKSIEGKAASSRNRRSPSMDYEGMAFVKWLLAEGKTVTQIIGCESKLSSVHIYDGSTCPRRAVTPRQVAAVKARLALLQERLAALRATRPPAPLSFYQPCWGNDASFLGALGNDHDFAPVTDIEGLLESVASGFGGDEEGFDWDDAASFDEDEAEDFFGDVDGGPNRDAHAPVESTSPG